MQNASWQGKTVIPIKYCCNRIGYFCQLEAQKFVNQPFDGRRRTHLRDHSDPQPGDYESVAKKVKAKVGMPGDPVISCFFIGYVR